MTCEEAMLAVLEGKAVEYKRGPWGIWRDLREEFNHGMQFRVRPVPEVVWVPGHFEYIMEDGTRRSA